MLEKKSEPFFMLFQLWFIKICSLIMGTQLTILFCKIVIILLFVSFGKKYTESLSFLCHYIDSDRLSKSIPGRMSHLLSPLPKTISVNVYLCAAQFVFMVES